VHAFTYNNHFVHYIDVIVFCLQYSLQDVFRNQSAYDSDAVELACDGVIMDMAYCPVRFVILYNTITFIQVHLTLVKMLAIHCFNKKVSLQLLAEVWHL